MALPGRWGSPSVTKNLCGASDTGAPLCCHNEIAFHTPWRILVGRAPHQLVANVVGGYVEAPITPLVCHTKLHPGRFDNRQFIRACVFARQAMRNEPSEGKPVQTITFPSIGFRVGSDRQAFHR